LAWTVEFQLTAQKQFRQLDRTIQQRIRDFFRNRVLTVEDPRQFGKALTGDKGGLWRYRIGDYRAICKIEDERLIVLVLEIGHRREVYR
jgi:mRNA interferase RelE/StbE